MPRVALSTEQKMAYKLSDFKKWVRVQMALNKKSQSEVGKVLGVSQVRVSQMLKDPNEKKKGERINPDPFSYGQVIALCDFFGASKEEKERFLTI
ncbi:MAG: hypothetical protein HDQ95_07445 [Roseburia sp.]|nr:hypothetical protein [Roseburia sp.]